MKESESRLVVELDAINPTTGELFKLTGTNEESNKYYSISKITSRVNAMNLFSTMELVCKSSKDIHIFNYLTEKADSGNKLRIDNISALADELEVSRVKLTKFLKLLTDSDFTFKLDRGVYMINPFIFVGRRVKSNELRESAQSEWKQITEE